jgi:MFS family permease
MKRDYRIVLVSTLISSMLGGMLYPVLSIYAKNASGDYLFSGLMFAFPFIITVVMSFAWGAFSDRIGNRKAPLIAGAVIGSVFFFVFPFLDVVPLLAARSIQTVFTASGILSTAIVTEYYPQDKGRSIGLLNVAGAAGGTIGGIALGFLLARSDILGRTLQVNTFFYVCGGLSILSALILFPIHENYRKRAPQKGLFRLKSGKRIAVICVSASILAAGTHTVYSIFPAYLADDYGVELGVLGWFIASSAIFGVLGSIAAGALCDRYGKRKIFIGVMLVYVLSMLSYGIANNFYILLVVWSLPLWPFYWIAGTSLVSDLTDETERGKGLGLLNAVSLGIGGFAGCIIGGFLLDYVSFTTLCIIAAVLCLTAAAIALAVVDTGKPCKPPSVGHGSRWYYRLFDSISPKH